MIQVLIGDPPHSQTTRSILGFVGDVVCQLAVERRRSPKEPMDFLFRVLKGSWDLVTRVINNNYTYKYL